MKNPYTSALLVAGFFSLLGVTLVHAQQSASTAAFRQLASLAGEWIGVQNGDSALLSYTLIADGSTLVEEFRPAKGATMMTMFSVDGDRLIATHYCSAGNQPQMATGPIEWPVGASFEFSLVRVTGMGSADDWHNIALEIQLEGKEHLIQRWTYLDHGKRGTTVLHFSRKQA